MVKERSLALNLSDQNGESVRIILVDENSGRIGSITLPAEEDASQK